MRHNDVMSENHAHDHGSTPAAWTAVTIMLIGTVIGCWAVVILNWWLLAVGFGVIAVGVVVGWAMSMMGYGKAYVEHEEAQA
jgi:hypothetical protein